MNLSFVHMGGRLDKEIMLIWTHVKVSVDIEDVVELGTDNIICVCLSFVGRTCDQDLLRQMPR